MLKVGDFLKLGIMPSDIGAPESIEWVVLQVEKRKAKICSRKGMIRWSFGAVGRSAWAWEILVL